MTKPATTLALLGGPPVFDHPLPVYRSIGAEERQAVDRVLGGGELSGFYGSVGDRFLGGPEVRRFEQAWCAYFGCRQAVAMNSATSALMAAIAACGVGEGDEVVVPPYTMMASATAAKLWGARAVFADIRPDTYTLDMDSVRACLTPRTKAVMVVNLFGLPADLDDLVALCRPLGIKVIEDNAQAPGALYRGRQAGTIGDIGVFSLNCHKTIQTGEGGVAVTDDPDLALRLQLIRNHGEAVVRELGYDRAPEKLIGFNFRMGEIEAAIGVEQLAKLDRLTAPRQRIAEALADGLGDLPGLTLPAVPDDRGHVYYVHALQIAAEDAGVSRRSVVRALAAEGVETFEGYVMPLYREPLFATDPGNRPGRCPVTEDLWSGKLFFHAWVFPEIEPLVDRLVQAFRKVWDHRADLAAVDDDGGTAVRRR